MQCIVNQVIPQESNQHQIIWLPSMEVARLQIMKIYPWMQYFKQT
jgi:hypothetical protein